MVKYPQKSRMHDSEERPSFLSTELFPFRSRFMDLDGHRIHYIDEGKGPTLVFYHGNPTYSFLYRKVIGGLLSNFRCIAFDYPGFGLSKAAATYDFLPQSHAEVSKRFLEKLKIRKYSPVMSDWGGPIGLNVASLQPDRVERLIIGNTFAWPVNGDFHFEAFSRFFGGFPGIWIIPRFHAFVRMLIPAGTKRARLSQEEMNAYLLPMPDGPSRMPTYIFPREIRKSKEFLTRLEERLATLREKPTLFLWADADIAFRKTELHRFQSHFPRNATTILKGSGHFLWEDDPETIIDTILEFAS